MTTILSGTNRPASRTRLIAGAFQEALAAAGAETALLDLAELDHAYFDTLMYDPEHMQPALRQLQERYVLGAEKLAIVVPEYNGSYPGAVKTFLDGISINEYARNWKGKRVALIGVSSGRAGNLRGLDHLADVLAHMGAWVLPNRLPVSLVDSLVTGDELTDEATKTTFAQLAQQLIAA